MDATYDAARFLKSITKTAPPAKPPEPPPQAPIAKSEPVVPQKPVVLPVVKPAEDKEASYRRRMDDELGGTVELLMFPEFFSETGDDVTVANAVRVFQWVLDQGKNVSRATVNEAVKALKKQLVPLRKPEPVKLAPPQPVVQTTPQPVVPDPDEGLPPLPDYVKRVLGKNPLRSRKDVHAIPTQLYSDLYRGPHAEAFRKRVNAALAR